MLVTLPCLQWDCSSHGCTTWLPHEQLPRSSPVCCFWYIWAKWWIISTSVEERVSLPRKGLRTNRWADGQNRMLARCPTQKLQPPSQKRADEQEAKEFLSYGEFCPQISPHTGMKSPSLDRELEVLLMPEAPRTPIPVKAVMRQVLGWWSELQVLMLIMNVLLKIDFFQWERSWD